MKKKMACENIRFSSSFAIRLLKELLFGENVLGTEWTLDDKFSQKKRVRTTKFNYFLLVVWQYKNS